jgi:hypothetical protein
MIKSVEHRVKCLEKLSGDKGEFERERFSCGIIVTTPAMTKDDIHRIMEERNKKFGVDLFVLLPETGSG